MVGSVFSDFFIWNAALFTMPKMKEDMRLPLCAASRAIRHIRAIERHGRREWYKLSGYTKRSMVENAVYRYKAIIGPEMRARTLARQRVEHRIGCEILNKMAALGMPDTYCAG